MRIEFVIPIESPDVIRLFAINTEDEDGLTVSGAHVDVATDGGKLCRVEMDVSFELYEVEGQ